MYDSCLLGMKMDFLIFSALVEVPGEYHSSTFSCFGIALEEVTPQPDTPTYRTVPNILVVIPQSTRVRP